MRQDFHEAIRRLIARPTFSAIAILTLAIGIGANTAIFSAVTALLVRPLPVPDDERVVSGLALREGFDPFGTSLLEYSAYRDRTNVFAASGVAQQQWITIATREEPERVHGAEVTSGFLSALGVAPVAGRALRADDDAPGAPPVALIGFELWRRRFGGDPKAVGSTLPLETGTVTIVGVMPPGFDLPAGAAVWTPLQLNADTLPLPQRAATAYSMIGRLRPGLAITDADRELKAVARQLEDEYPQFRRGWTYRILPLRQYLIGDLAGRNRLALLTLSAAVGCLLLICCANVANLLLVRGIARQREMAVRLALGASRWRVARHLLVESAVLAGAGGAAGLLLATWIMPVLAALNPIHVSAFAASLSSFELDRRVLAFAAALSAATGALFGMLPAARIARRGDVTSVLRAREQRTTASGARWLAALVVAETAIAVALLVNGSLVAQSFARLQHVDLGFDPSHALTLEMSLSERQQATPADRVAAVDRLLAIVNSTPGVVAAGISTNVPLQLFSGDSVFTVEGKPVRNLADVPITANRIVTPDYLRALGVRLVAGRLLTDRDRDGAPLAVVVSQEFARQAWGVEDPIGRRVRRGRAQDTTLPWLTVVGVIADIKEDRFNFRIDRPAWYVPYAQQPVLTSLNLLTRIDGNAAAAAPAIRAAIRAFDSQQTVSNVRTMAEDVGEVLATERVSALLMTVLAGIALFLAAGGVYGVMSYVVGQRAAEIGVRIALGANRGDVVRLVMREGLALVGAGLVIGAAIARAGAVALASTLYGVQVNDLATFGGAAAALAAAGLIACYLPAHRAARLDPLSAIKSE